MLSHSVAETYSLSLLPNVLRTLSQLGRSGLVRFKSRGFSGYFDIDSGWIRKMQIEERGIIDYLLKKLSNGGVLAPNVCNLLRRKVDDLEILREIVAEEASISGEFFDLLVESTQEEVLIDCFFNVEADLELGPTDMAFGKEIGVIFEDSREPLLKARYHNLEVNRSISHYLLDIYDSFRERIKLSKGALIYQAGSVESFQINLCSSLEHRILEVSKDGVNFEFIIRHVCDNNIEIIRTLNKLRDSSLLVVREESGLGKESAMPFLDSEIVKDLPIVPNLSPVDLKEDMREDMVGGSKILEQQFRVDWLVTFCLHLVVVVATFRFGLFFYRYARLFGDYFVN